MAALSTMSALSRRIASTTRSQSLLVYTTSFCVPVPPPSYTPARLFSIVHPLRVLHDIPPSPKIDLRTVQTPTYKPSPQKQKQKAAVPNKPSPQKAQANLGKSRKSEGKGLATVPAAGTVATRIADAYMGKLLAKGTETPMYEAPNHVWFTIGSLFMSTFCIAYAFYNSYFHVMHPPPDIMWWVPYAYGVICAMMAAMGTFFFLSPTKIISHIKTVPTTQELLRKVKTKAARESKLLVEVGIRRPFIGWEPKKLYVAPSDISMKKKLSAPLMTMSKGELVAMERRLKEKREKEIRYDKENLMTAPFRQMGRAFSELFRGIRRMASREGFADVTIAGRSYKLDVLGGWALEDGRAVDRLLAPKENGAGF